MPHDPNMFSRYMDQTETSTAMRRQLEAPNLQEHGDKTNKLLLNCLKSHQTNTGNLLGNLVRNHLLYITILMLKRGESKASCHDLNSVSRVKTTFICFFDS